MDTNTILGIFVGYLIGSIPFPFIFGKLVKGIDLRQVGSHNVGGRNAFHSIGPFWGVLAGALDAVKGIGALLAAQALGGEYPGYLLAGLAAIAGHNWPVWLRFKGGKGLAVAMGIGAYLALPETAIAVVVGGALLWFTSNVTVAAFIGYVLLLALLWLRGQSPEYMWLLLGAALLGVIGILPNAIQMVRTQGAVREYFKRPSKVYETEPEEQERQNGR